MSPGYAQPINETITPFSERNCAVMRNYGLGRGPKNKGYFADNDWEMSGELSPDPFSEEEHSIIHARRFYRKNNGKNPKNQENKRKQEK